MSTETVTHGERLSLRPRTDRLRHYSLGGEKLSSWYHDIYYISILRKQQRTNNLFQALVRRVGSSCYPRRRRLPSCVDSLRALVYLYLLYLVVVSGRRLGDISQSAEIEALDTGKPALGVTTSQPGCSQATSKVCSALVVQHIHQNLANKAHDGIINSS